MTQLKRNSQQNGSALLIVTFFMIMGLGLGALFLSRSDSALSLVSTRYDSKDAQYRMEKALSEAEAKVEGAIENIALNGQLMVVASQTGDPVAAETFNALSTKYKDPGGDDSVDRANAMQFLRDAVIALSYSNGQQDEDHEYADFDAAFPTAWTDPDPNDDEFYEYRFEFHPRPTYMDTDPAILAFEYEYVIGIRAFGAESFSNMSSELTGVISVELRNSPFSKWALILNELRNQNGSLLVWAGGNTEDQFQSVYNGPVHVNGAAYFYGHPIFNDLFTSGTPESSWRNYTAADYDCCAQFNNGKQDNVDMIDFPTELFNTVRLAAGDPSETAANNQDPVTDSDLVSFLSNHTNGTVSGSSVPEGIYVPVNNQVDKEITGGLYVEGDAEVFFNVVQGSGDFTANQWASIDPLHQGCKFQKIKVDHDDAGVETREIYVGDDPCEVTYVFNGDDDTEAPVLANGRMNGNVYVNGTIEKLGGESRTRPAIAKDFSFHVTALKDVRIYRDLQYEDAEYYSEDSDGSVGSTKVATPWGEYGGSGYDPTSNDITVSIDEDSKTVLGISSLKRNIKIHIDGPPNINLHAALFAGNDQPYDSATGFGCNANHENKRGCGWGVEGWDSVTNRGAIKLLGSIAHYRSQTTGRLSNPPTGYESKFFYDSRLRSILQPPAFPVSDDFGAFSEIRSFKAWRISQAD